MNTETVLKKKHYISATVLAIVLISAFIIVGFIALASEDDDLTSYMLDFDNMLDAFYQITYETIEDETNALLALAEERIPTALIAYVAKRKQEMSDATNINDPRINWEEVTWSHLFINSQDVIDEYENMMEIDFDERSTDLIGDTFIYRIRSAVNPDVGHSLRFTFRIGDSLTHLTQEQVEATLNWIRESYPDDVEAFIERMRRDGFIVPDFDD
ncbi:MAG: hypothetical protein FWE33_00120 [Defluviitaleaceae bacterium]|nr:hypothetical protein [Defluviitaleaceae bacterium]